MNRHNLPLAWHAATDMSAIGWAMIANSSNCLISQEWLASIAEGDSIINATLLYLCQMEVQGKIFKLHAMTWGLKPLFHGVNCVTKCHRASKYFHVNPLLLLVVTFW